MNSSYKFYVYLKSILEYVLNKQTLYVWPPINVASPSPW